MLDKLIESKNNSLEKRRLNGILASAFTAVISILAVALVYSLFSYNLVLGSDDLEISTLLSPADFENEPPPKPIAEQIRKTVEKTSSDLPTRQDNIQRPDESPFYAPKTISTTPMTQKTRPNSAFRIDKDDFDPAVLSTEINRRSNAENTTGIYSSSKPELKPEINETEAPKIKRVQKPNPPTNVIVSKGVINGQAKNLVKPAYPPAAIAVGARGEVKVQVTIDEEGRVISAVAVSGHSLLKSAAVNAARLSTFTPTFLSEQKVKVTGVIIYNFTR